MSIHGVMLNHRGKKALADFLAKRSGVTVAAPWAVPQAPHMRAGSRDCYAGPKCARRTAHTGNWMKARAGWPLRLHTGRWAPHAMVCATSIYNLKGAYQVGSRSHERREINGRKHDRCSVD